MSNSMKTKLILGALILSTSIAHATLIDLTPGGFNLSDPWPTPVIQFFGYYGQSLENLAGANINGNQVDWSPFTPFGEDHFDINLNQPFANVGWDLTGTGARLRYVFAESDQLIAHLYAVRGFEMFSGSGEVTIDGEIPLIAITFAGSFGSVPDSGYTIILMVIGLSVILMASLIRPKHELP